MLRCIRLLKAVPLLTASPVLFQEIIVEVGGKAITSAEQLVEFSQNLIKGKENSSPVLVRFERDQASIITVIEIGPEPIERRPVEAWKAWLGVGTQVITPELAKALKLKPNTTGIRLTQIFKDTHIVQD